MDEIGLLITVIICVIVGIGISEYSHWDDKAIGAMEVYKGNTKLQYTIVDSVKVDSCVIFLNK